MTRMNPGTIIVSAVMLVVAIMVLANSNITFPPEGWLVASLLGAAAILVGGESFIKKQGLADTGAKAARAAYVFGAVVVAGTGIYFTVMSYVTPGASLPTWLEDAIREIGWFGVISLAVIALTLVFGAWRYRLIPGNTSVYLLIAAIGFFIIVGGAYVIMMKLAPQETEMILGAAKNDIQGAAQGLVKTDPYGGTSIDWKQIGEFNWGKFFGISFFGLCVIGVGVFLFRGHKIVTFIFVIVASLLVFPTAFYYSWTFAVPEPVKEFVTGAATTVYEANPALGDRQRIQLSKSDLGRDIAVSLGIYDDLVVSLPLGDRTSGFALCIDASANWKQNYGHQPWFDRNHVVDIASDVANVNHHIKVAKTMKDGMKADNVTQVSYIISLIRVGTPCLPQ